jgi:maltooligosyltrehalose synthase
MAEPLALREDWPVEGTTGGEFATRPVALLVPAPDAA